MMEGASSTGAQHAPAVSPDVKPVITEWLRKRTMKPRRSTPTPVYMQATRNASWMTCKAQQRRA